MDTSVGGALLHFAHTLSVECPVGRQKVQRGAVESGCSGDLELRRELNQRKDVVDPSAAMPPNLEERKMHGIFYIIGVVVVVLAILNFAL